MEGVLPTNAQQWPRPGFHPCPEITPERFPSPYQRCLHEARNRITSAQCKLLQNSSQRMSVVRNGWRCPQKTPGTCCLDMFQRQSTTCNPQFRLCLHTFSVFSAYFVHAYSIFQQYSKNFSCKENDNFKIL